MIVDKSIFMHGAAGLAQGAGNTRTESGGANRAAWQREMERQELAAWFSHPAGQPGRAGPVAPAAHAHAVPRAVPAMAPIAAAHPMSEPQRGSTTPPAPSTPPAVEQSSRPHGVAAAVAAARDAPAAAQDPGPGNRTSGHEDGAAPSAASAEAPQEPGGTMPLPMPAADLVAAVMTHLEQGPDAESAAGTGGPAPAPAVLDAQGLPATDVRSAPMTTPLAPTVPAARRLLWTGTDGMPSGEFPQTDDAQAPHTGATARTGAAGAPLPQLRIHTVRTGDGVRIWIGADQAAGLSGEQLLDAAHDIQRLLKERGTPLVALTYNGESVLERGEDGPEDRSEWADADASPPRAREKSGTSPRIET
jgi:hypothetical protein